MDLELPPINSIENYISAARRFPLLTHEKEIELAKRLRDHNDLDAARELILSNLRIVIHIARGYAGYGLQLSDLIQEGNVGLMKAVKAFDPDRNVRLFSFAIYWIKAEIHEFIIRNWRLVKIATTKAHRKLFFNLRSMKKELNTLKPDEVEAIAKELNVEPAEVIEMEKRFSNSQISIGGHVDSDEEITQQNNENLLVDDRPLPDEAIDIKRREFLSTTGLETALEELDKREQDIVKSRWLNDSPQTLTDLGNKYGVSAERIRQIETKAIGKMRRTLANLA